MKVLIFIITFCTVLFSAYAQEKVMMALAVNADPEHISSGWLLHIDKANGVQMTYHQPFVCKGIYQSEDDDTATKGNGFISAMHDDCIECFINEDQVKLAPKAGDLCYFMVEGLSSRTDVFYKLARFAISFLSVTDTVLFDAKDNRGEWDTGNISRLLQAFTNDIHFTAGEMLKQNDSQQQIIEGGDFSGKPLFTAMQQVKANDILNFLKYVWARPAKYAGHNWKISEVFATWMVSGTPAMTGEIN